MLRFQFWRSNHKFKGLAQANPGDAGGHGLAVFGGVVAGNEAASPAAVRAAVEGVAGEQVALAGRAVHQKAGAAGAVARSRDHFDFAEQRR